MMKELIAQGALGEVISVQHFEPIGHTHMAHSYVRGNWHNSKETTPIILAKSCHDLDIIKWVIDKHSKKIVAMGDLKWFRKENAPEGSTARFTDGCKNMRGSVLTQPFRNIMTGGHVPRFWIYLKISLCIAK